jgi:hypothetical protein
MQAWKVLSPLYTVEETEPYTICATYLPVDPADDL